MYGFDIVVNGRNSVWGDIKYNNITCYNHFIDKFSNDKVFFETNDLIVILDGVILNLKKYGEGKNAVNKLYDEYGENFFQHLRGSFAGALYQKKLDRWIIFTDHIGSRFVYYTIAGSMFICSEMMSQMYQHMRNNDIKYSLSVRGAYMMLSYGFMLEDYTLCEQVKKIQPGCYITYEKGKVKEYRYFMLNNTPEQGIDENDAIEMVDSEFRRAVTTAFDKDKEYGYQHIAALSAGLDSRMTCLVAHHCGFKKQLNITFSQSNYWDEIIPKQIADDYKHEWLFKALDNGLWLYEVERVTLATGGNVLYYGTAHGDSLYRLMNFEKYGSLHSGQLGDVIIGSNIPPSHFGETYQLGEGAYSKAMINKLQDTGYGISMNVNKEIGLFYYRYLNGTNNGQQNIYNYTETLSPFMDVDLLSNIAKLPIQLRYKHHLYKKWIIDKYPDAARYVWESIGTTITAPTLKIGEREIPFSKITRSMKSHARMILGLSARSANSKSHMNPVDYYYTHNSELRHFIDSYSEYIKYINDKKLREDIKELMLAGTPMERIQAVSLLAAIKLFYV